MQSNEKIIIRIEFAIKPIVEIATKRRKPLLLAWYHDMNRINNKDMKKIDSRVESKIVYFIKAV